MPVDGKKKITPGVLPKMLKSNALCVYFQDVITADHEVFAEGLLQSCVELIAEAGLQGP